MSRRRDTSSKPFENDMNQETRGARKGFVSRAGWFSLDYPSDWDLEETDYIAVYDPRAGVGALHISAYEGPDDIDPKAELIEHLNDENQVANEESVKTRHDGSKTVASYEFISGGSFQRVWFVADRCYLVIATYISDAKDKDADLSEIEQVVRSIKSRPNFPETSVS